MYLSSKNLDLLSLVACSVKVKYDLFIAGVCQFRSKLQRAKSLTLCALILLLWSWSHKAIGLSNIITCCFIVTWFTYLNYGNHCPFGLLHSVSKVKHWLSLHSTAPPFNFHVLCPTPYNCTQNPDIHQQVAHMEGRFAREQERILSVYCPRQW